MKPVAGLDLSREQSKRFRAAFFITLLLIASQDVVADCWVSQMHNQLSPVFSTPQEAIDWAGAQAPLCPVPPPSIPFPNFFSGPNDVWWSDGLVHDGVPISYLAGASRRRDDGVCVGVNLVAIDASAFGATFVGGALVLFSQVYPQCGAKKYTVKLSRRDGLPPESGTVLYSSEPGQPGPELVATVYDEHNQLVPNVVVQLQANAIPNTGGHQHGDNSVTLRTGTLASADSSAKLSQNAQVLSGNTGSTGLVFTYNAQPVGGDNTIAATCIDNHHCTQQGPMQVWVGIKGLRPLGLNVYILVPNATKDPGHPDNHYLTPIAAGVVAVFANLYHAAYPDNSLLQLNDASLERGGIFDLSHNWKSPHEQHCRGTVVDIRANGVDGALNITSDTDPMIYRVQKIGNKVGAIPAFEVPPDVAGVPVWDARHFHTLLIGREGRQCP